MINAEGDQLLSRDILFGGSPVKFPLQNVCQNQLQDDKIIFNQSCKQQDRS